MSHDAKHDPEEVSVRTVLPGDTDPYGWVERAVCEVDPILWTSSGPL